MAKQMSMKEKEEKRRKNNTVSNMINQEVQVQKDNLEDNQQQNGEPDNNIQINTEKETIESLKRQLEDAKAALKVQSKERRIKDKKISLSMYSDVYAALQKKCKKKNISVTECLNQLAEIWVNQED